MTKILTLRKSGDSSLCLHCCPALIPYLHLITTSRTSGAAIHLLFFDDLLLFHHYTAVWLRIDESQSQLQPFQRVSKCHVSGIKEWFIIPDVFSQLQCQSCIVPLSSVLLNFTSQCATAEPSACLSYYCTCRACLEYVGENYVYKHIRLTTIYIMYTF